MTKKRPKTVKNGQKSVFLLKIIKKPKKTRKMGQKRSKKGSKKGHFWGPKTGQKKRGQKSTQKKTRFLQSALRKGVQKVTKIENSQKNFHQISCLCDLRGSFFDPFFDPLVLNWLQKTGFITDIFGKKAQIWGISVTSSNEGDFQKWPKNTPLQKVRGFRGGGHFGSKNG